MKTRDSISKKRQELHNQALFWDARAVATLANLGSTPEEQAAQKKKAAFCRQEAAKRRDGLTRLMRGSVRQYLSGWH